MKFETWYKRGPGQRFTTMRQCKKLYDFLKNHKQEGFDYNNVATNTFHVYKDDIDWLGTGTEGAVVRPGMWLCNGLGFMNTVAGEPVREEDEGIPVRVTGELHITNGEGIIVATLEKWKGTFNCGDFGDYRFVRSERQWNLLYRERDYYELYLRMLGELKTTNRAQTRVWEELVKGEWYAHHTLVAAREGRTLPGQKGIPEILFDFGVNLSVQQFLAPPMHRTECFPVISFHKGWGLVHGSWYPPVGAMINLLIPDKPERQPCRKITDWACKKIM